MGLYLSHVNTVLSKLREPVITALSTNEDTEAFKAQRAVQRAVNRIFNSKTWSFRQRRQLKQPEVGALVSFNGRRVARQDSLKVIPRFKYERACNARNSRATDSTVANIA